MNDDFKEYLSTHSDLEMLPSGKCRCKVTGHEMVANKSIAEVHLILFSWFMVSPREWVVFVAGTSER